MDKILKELIESQKGSGFAEVFKIIASGKFKDAIDDLEEGDEVIGELSLLERGLSSYLFQLSEQHGAIIKAIRSMDRNKESELLMRAMRDLEKLGETFEFYEDIFWRSIKERLKIENDVAVVVRSEFRIVKISREKTSGVGCDCDMCNAAKKFAGAALLVIRKKDSLMSDEKGAGHA